MERRGSLRSPERIANKGYIREAFLNVQGSRAANCFGLVYGSHVNIVTL